MSSKNEAFLKPLIDYNYLIYSRNQSTPTKDTFDQIAYHVYKNLKTLKLETPFHKETMINFDEYVYHFRNKLMTIDEEKDLKIYNKTVLNLLQHLDKAAKKQDYKNYKDAIFELDNLKETPIRNGLLQLIGIHGKFQQKTVKTKHISFDNFFEKLSEIGHPAIHRNKLSIIDKIMRQFDNDSFLMNIDFEDSKCQKDIYTGMIDQNKIIVRTPKIKTLFDLKLFLGELSKAILIFYRLLDSEFSDVRDGKLRALGVMVEQSLIELVCTKTERHFITRIQMLENSYYSTLALFEFDLQEKRKSPRDLFKDIMNPVFKVKDSDIWGPAITYHGNVMMSHYVPIGYIMYQNLKTIQKSEKLRKKNLGKWLKDSVLIRFKDIGIDALI